MRLAILGATRGLGRALARRAAARGDDVFLLGRDPDALARSAADLEARGLAGPVRCARVDLREPDGTLTLSRVPDLADINTLAQLLEHHGVEIKMSEDRPGEGGRIRLPRDLHVVEIDAVCVVPAVEGGVARFQAGAGIVADSVPEREYQETIHKSNAIRTAIAMAEGGLSSV